RRLGGHAPHRQAGGDPGAVAQRAGSGGEALAALGSLARSRPPVVPGAVLERGRGLPLRRRGRGSRVRSLRRRVSPQPDLRRGRSAAADRERRPRRPHRRSRGAPAPDAARTSLAGARRARVRAAPRCTRARGLGLVIATAATAAVEHASKRAAWLAVARRHWPEYAIEAAGLGLFMVAACSFATILEFPGSRARLVLPDPMVRRALMGLMMGLTATVLIYSRWGMRSGAHFNPAV